MQSSFWKNKRIFITGLTGFKGSWLGLILNRLGAIVTGYSLPPEHPLGIYSQLQLEHLFPKTLRSIHADIMDLASLQQSLQKSEAEIVIHMAAQSLVKVSYEQPTQTFSTNVMGTVHLLEAVRSVSSVKAVLVVTSDKCYENSAAGGQAFQETDRLGGFDPYASSKACAELVSSCYRDAFLSPSGIALATARAGNVIGGGDWSSDRLIPDLMRGMLTEQPVLIRNPKAIRPWQHVLEPLTGYLMLCRQLMETPKQAIGSWNFGPSPDSARSVSYLLETIETLWPHCYRWEMDESIHAPESQILKLDSSKAQHLLGWMPRFELDEMLTFTMDWYQAQAEKQDLLALSLRQIDDYMAAQPGFQEDSLP